jgi:hypothetical protein
MLANAQSKVMKTSPSFNKKTGDHRVSGKERREGEQQRRGYRYIRQLQLEYLSIQRGISSYYCLDETMKSPALVVG